MFALIFLSFEIMNTLKIRTLTCINTLIFVVVCFFLKSHNETKVRIVKREVYY